MLSADSPVRTGAREKSAPNGGELAEDRFHQLPHVISTRAGDAVVLMDRKRGAYFTLNEVGGRVWEIVETGATTSEIVAQLLAEYEVDREQLETDVAATLRRLVDNGLATRGGPSNRLSPELAHKSSLIQRGSLLELKVPSVLWCGLLIAWFKALLRVRGFLGTVEWLRKRVERLSVTAEAEIDSVKAVEYAVAMAGALYPGRAECLEQSLVLYYLLRRSGVAAAYCQGVQLSPFEAHAWIEYCGKVLNDVPDHTRFFARLPEQLP